MDWLNNLQEWLSPGMDDQGDWNSQKQNGPIHLKLSAFSITVCIQWKLKPHHFYCILPYPKKVLTEGKLIKVISVLMCPKQKSPDCSSYSPVLPPVLSTSAALHSSTCPSPNPKRYTRIFLSFPLASQHQHICLRAPLQAPRPLAGLLTGLPAFTSAIRSPCGRQRHLLYSFHWATVAHKHPCDLMPA